MILRHFEKWFGDTSDALCAVDRSKPVVDLSIFYRSFKLVATDGVVLLLFHNLIIESSSFLCWWWIVSGAVVVRLFNVSCARSCLLRIFGCSNAHFRGVSFSLSRSRCCSACGFDCSASCTQICMLNGLDDWLWTLELLSILDKVAVACCMLTKADCIFVFKQIVALSKLFKRCKCEYFHLLRPNHAAIQVLSWHG